MIIKEKFNLSLEINSELFSLFFEKVLKVSKLYPKLYQIFDQSFACMYCILGCGN
jgi:hypothetical protein